jgi:hypothetical protein
MTVFMNTSYHTDKDMPNQRIPSGVRHILTLLANGKTGKNRACVAVYL